MIGPCALLSLYFTTCTSLPMIIDAADIPSSSYLLRWVALYLLLYVLIFAAFSFSFHCFALIASSFLRLLHLPPFPSYPRTSSDVLATCHYSFFHLLTLTYTSAACICLGGSVVARGSLL